MLPNTPENQINTLKDLLSNLEKPDSMFSFQMERVEEYFKQLDESQLSDVCNIMNEVFSKAMKKENIGFYKTMQKKVPGFVWDIPDSELI